jgi:hypothetical protein
MVRVRDEGFVNAFPEEPEDITEHQFVLIRVRSLPVYP